MQRVTKSVIEVAVRSPRQRPAQTAERSTTQTQPAPASRPSRTAQAMNAGAGIVLGEDDEALQLALAREFTGNVRRKVMWAVHELRDMGHLARDLVETAERFAMLHLRLEPREKCASTGDGVRGGDASPHRAMLKRTALSERVDELYAVVGKKLGASDLAVFAMAFDPIRPSVSEMKAASGRDFAALCRIVETGLTKLWACEPIVPSARELNSRFTTVNELARI